MTRNILLGGLLAGVALGCSGEAPAPEDQEAELVQAEQELNSNALQKFMEKRGEKIFKKRKFLGNGRTCDTCHGNDGGTLNPEDVQALYASKPNDPLFASDSDDGAGNDFTSLLNDATIEVEIPLPDNLRACDDLDNPTFRVRRGIPSVINASVDAAGFNWDGRFDDLQSQANAAVNAHYEPGRQPIPWELDSLAAYQQTLFSSNDIESYADGGAAPQLPPGTTPAEQRGRDFFLPDGKCGKCHSGAMLNRKSEFHPDPPFIGDSFDFNLAGELFLGNQPLVDWCAVDPATGEVEFQVPFPVPDPGRAVVNEDPFAVGVFKIPTLWNTIETAPYFHDNSAKDLDDLLDHYALFFLIDERPGWGPPLTEQDKADIIAYIQLL